MALNVTDSSNLNGLDSEGITTIQYLDLKEWTKGQSVIPALSDTQLRTFLHSCYYDVENTKKTLLAYYSLRTTSPQLFFSRDPSCSEITSIRSIVYIGLLPGVTKEGYYVIAIGHLHSDSTDFVFNDSMKYVMMAIDTIIANMPLSSGYIILIETGNYTFGHLKKSNFDTVKKTVTYFQDALPIRMKKMVLLNVNSAMMLLLNMIHPFLNARMRETIEKYAPGNTEYFKIVPEDMLPIELGGTGGKSLRKIQDETHDLLMKNKECLARDDTIFQDLAKKQPLSRSFLGIHY